VGVTIRFDTDIHTVNHKPVTTVHGIIKNALPELTVGSIDPNALINIGVAPPIIKALESVLFRFVASVNREA
jgi:hypothetical protein